MRYNLVLKIYVMAKSLEHNKSGNSFGQELGAALASLVLPLLWRVVDVWKLALSANLVCKTSWGIWNNTVFIYCIAAITLEHNRSGTLYLQWGKDKSFWISLLYPRQNKFVDDHSCWWRRKPIVYENILSDWRLHPWSEIKISPEES